MPLVVVSLALALQTLRFLGDPTCPSAAEIRDRLAFLNPEPVAGEAQRLVLVEPQGQKELSVRLFDGDGRLLAEQSDGAPHACAFWAQWVAVLLSSWEAALPAPDPTALQLPPPPPPLSRSPVQSSVVEISSTPAKSSAAWRAEVAGGLLSTLANDGSLAFGGELRVGLDPQGKAYGGQALLLVEGSRRLALGTGFDRWQRFGLGVGLHRNLLGNKAPKPGRLRLELGGDLLAGLVSGEGEGFSVTRAEVALSPGLQLSARLVLPLPARLTVWCQLGGLVWPRLERAQVLVQGLPVDAQIPPVEIALALELGFLKELGL